MQQILPFGGRGKAEQAMKRSVSIFTNSKIAGYSPFAARGSPAFNPALLGTFKIGMRLLHSLDQAQ